MQMIGQQKEMTGMMVIKVSHTASRVVAKQASSMPGNSSYWNQSLIQQTSRVQGLSREKISPHQLLLGQSEMIKVPISLSLRMAIQTSLSRRAGELLKTSQRQVFQNADATYRLRCSLLRQGPSSQSLEGSRVNFNPSSC